jgi:hypothetical protein
MVCLEGFRLYPELPLVEFLIFFQPQLVMISNKAGLVIRAATVCYGPLVHSHDRVLPQPLFGLVGPTLCLFEP